MQYNSDLTNKAKEIGSVRTQLKSLKVKSSVASSLSGPDLRQRVAILSLRIEPPRAGGATHAFRRPEQNLEVVVADDGEGEDAPTCLAAT
jgi:hypothetical protein